MASDKLIYTETEDGVYTDIGGGRTIKVSERLDLSHAEDREILEMWREQLASGKVCGRYAGVSWELV
jgi:hypothetical protein